MLMRFAVGDVVQLPVPLKSKAPAASTAIEPMVCAVVGLVCTVLVDRRS